MEKLIYARWASRVEIDAFIDDIKKRNQKDYLSSISYMDNHREEIINQYNLLLNTYYDLHDQAKKKRQLYFNAYRSGTCICGGSVELVHFYNFYGCENYRNEEVKHKNFVGDNFGWHGSFKEYLDDVTKVKTDDWVLLLKHKAKLPKKLKLNSLYQFIKMNNLECINYIFKNEHILDKLNNFRDSIKKGVDFEHEVKEMLEKRHQNLYYQQAIKYQYQERQQLFAIPDFISVDDENIIIYECKLNESLIDTIQEQKYIDLISFIMKEKGMTQKLKFVYVFKENGIIVELDKNISYE